MKLCYRGVAYDHNPPSLEVTESEMQGHYRGHSLRFSYVKHIPFPQPVADLTYRGVPYQTNAQGQVQQVDASTTPSRRLFQADRLVSPMGNARLSLLREAATAHRDNIERSLNHRIEVARSQGDEQLLNQLEAEMHQLA